MESLFIPSEEDFKRWMSEAVNECLAKYAGSRFVKDQSEEELLDRKRAAELLRISTVTLTERTKNGLPHYRKNRRIFYVRSEVLDYMQTRFAGKMEFSEKWVGLGG